MSKPRLDDMVDEAVSKGSALGRELMARLNDPFFITCILLAAQAQVLALLSEDDAAAALLCIRQHIDNIEATLQRPPVRH